jgi:hypothetical protein
MQLDAMLWVLLPVFISAGSALLAYFVMHARMEVALAKERQVLAEAHAEIKTQKSTLEERVKATEAEARRRSLDDFMQEFRVEERHYFRDRQLENSKTRAMVLQERLYFRNIPLSSWVEHEMLVDETHSEDLQQLAKGVSLFTAKSLPEQGPLPHLIDSVESIAAYQHAS